MERILGGVLVAMCLTLGVSSTARAVEIPATAECQTTYQDLIQKGSKKSDGKSGDSGMKLLVNGLVDAGCLSDATPMLKNLKPEPFTDQCAAAASDAENYWGPLSARFDPWSKAFNRKVQHPFTKRSSRLWAKIDRADRRGQANRSEALNSRLERISRRYFKRIRTFIEKVRPFVEPQSDATILAVWELVSLRCISGGDLMKPRTGEAHRVLKENFNFVFSAMILPPAGWTMTRASASAIPGTTSLPSITRREH